MKLIRVIAGAMLALMANAGFAQDAAGPPRPPPLKEGEIKRYERLGDMPEAWLVAIKALPCRFDEDLIRIAPPFAFYLPRTGTFLVAHCLSVPAVHGYVFLLNRQHDYRPELETFPVLAYPAGIGTALSPGWIEWNAESKMLTATQSTDVCPAEIMRSTYQYGSGSYGFDNRSGWILMKIEREPKDCVRGVGSESWTTFWEAPSPPTR
jgi:hypothetical protein